VVNADYFQQAQAVIVECASRKEKGRVMGDGDIELDEVI
jgi:hypothetical protein